MRLSLAVRPRVGWLFLVTVALVAVVAVDVPGVQAQPGKGKAVPPAGPPGKYNVPIQGDSPPGAQKAAPSPGAPVASENAPTPSSQDEGWPDWLIYLLVFLGLGVVA